MAKVKTKEITNERNLISHIILNSLNHKAIETFANIEDRDDETVHDIKLLFNDVELDFKKTTKFLEDNWQSCLKDTAKSEAKRMFDEYVNKYNSKHCKNAKLEKIKLQIDKANNHLIQIQKSINDL